MNARTKISGLLAALWIVLLLLPANLYAAGEIADGTYTADYLILQAENDSVSMANDYWEKPAKVTIKDGKATVRVTINHSFWVTEFKVPGSGGGYVDTKLISSNKKADTRLVEFTADITKPIVSKIHVTVEDIDYDHDYTIRFVFDQESFKLVKGAEPAATAKPTAEPTAKPTTAPTSSSTEKPAVTGESAAEKPEQSSKPESTIKASDQSTTVPSEAAKPSETEGTAPYSTAETTANEAAVSAEPSPAEEQVPADKGDGEAGIGVENTTNEAGEAESSVDGDAQLADASAEEGESVQALAAGDAANAPEADSGSKSFKWWTPLGAVLILIVGAIYIWRRKAH
ncbi:heme uptake protein IsdC [Paenibacillus sp. YIM B09110]|uniref:heme uptake protein IsdC n=1 Tax=Paenibacillus sp. YIM B09110 TaxID=3126102 RepID=UPI00301C08C2